MEFNIERIPKMTIEEFADKHDLTMTVRERPTASTVDNRFYASFDSVELKGDGVLVSSFGNGATPEEAINNYATEIHLQVLVVDAMKPSRREIAKTRIKEATDE